MEREKLIRSLHELFAELSLEMNEQQCELFVDHLLLVLKYNKRLNLTRIENPEDGLILHIIDSLLPFSALPYPQGRFLDIGTGAGFPGVPFAIYTKQNGLLVDSVAKKVEAVQGMIQNLGLEEQLSAEVVRAEELATRSPEGFDFVLTRAVARGDVLVEYATPLLVYGGKLLIYKGQLEDSEFSQIERAAELCGLRIVSRETLQLPQRKGERQYVLLERCEDAQITLPRRVGVATKRPLGDSRA